jgi:penicillin-binding protein 1B
MQLEAILSSIDSAPARVYARPLVLHRGLDPLQAGLATHLARASYRLVPGPEVEPGEFAVRPHEWVIGVRPFLHARGHEPGGRLAARLDSQGRIESLRDEQGRELSQFRIEPIAIGALLGPEHKDRIPARLEDLPEHLVTAVLVSEDRRFFDHGGLDMRRLVGSALANLRSRRMAQGGSTITQQLVKSVYLTPERTIWRKLHEMFLAVFLEWRLSKEQILEAYLNEIYLGQAGPAQVHGVGLAARWFFGKDVRELRLAESALLAGIISAPNRYSPLRNSEAALERRNLILRLLHEEGHITQAEFTSANGEPLSLRTPLPEILSTSYFVDFLRKRLAPHHGRDLERGGLSIFTTLDLRLQAVAEEAIRGHLAAVERELPHLERKQSPLQVALVAIEPRTGQVLAMVGGRDYVRAPYDRVAAAHRQPGSVFKPVVALAALSAGGGDANFTLASVLRDEPFRLREPGGWWEPRNHDWQFRGDVTLREAIEHSLNVPIVRLADAIGLDRLISTARRMGIESPLEPVLSLALGAFEVSLLEITRVYGVLAAGGQRSPLRVALGVRDRDADALERAETPTLQVFSAAEVYLVTSALQGAADRGTGALVRELGYHGAIAAKTGSTDRFRDAWFIGYTPELVVGVWAGFDDNHRIGLPGSALALPVAVDFLTGALGSTGGGHFRPPRGVEQLRVSIEKRGQCRSVVELFLPGTAPTESCRRDQAGVAR